MVEHLTAALWEQEPCGHGVELATRGGAYVLRMPKALLDVHRFEDLVARAGEQRGPSEAVTMCREALSLWQGPALADV